MPTCYEKLGVHRVHRVRCRRGAGTVRLSQATRIQLQWKLLISSAVVVGRRSACPTLQLPGEGYCDAMLHNRSADGRLSGASGRGILGPGSRRWGGEPHAVPRQDPSAADGQRPYRRCASRRSCQVACRSCAGGRAGAGGRPDDPAPANRPDREAPGADGEGHRLRDRHGAGPRAEVAGGGLSVGRVRELLDRSPAGHGLGRRPEGGPSRDVRARFLQLRRQGQRLLVPRQDAGRGRSPAGQAKRVRVRRDGAAEFAGQGGGLRRPKVQARRGPRRIAGRLLAKPAKPARPPRPAKRGKKAAEGAEGADQPAAAGAAEPAAGGAAEPGAKPARPARPPRRGKKAAEGADQPAAGQP